MAFINELNLNNKLLCVNHDPALQNQEEPNINLNFLLNWSPEGCYLNFEELKVSKGYQMINEIEMVKLHEESNASIIKEQLQVRDNIILILHQYFEKIFGISQQLQIHLKELDKKKKKLLKIIRRQKQNRAPSKLEKKDSANYEDKNIQTEAEPQLSNWNLYYSQYYSRYYNSENNDERPAKMSTENISTEVSKTETFSDSPNSCDSISSNKTETSVEILEESCSKIVDDNLKVENITDTPDLNWNTVDVKEEVRELATEITKSLGYVFVEDYDMYYDHSSGYYYDHKTSLYYDSKTGTYFYYNYETGEYEFHSQVSPTASEEEPLSTHTFKSDKDFSTKEKEEGECSDSEESVDKEIQEQSIYGEDNIEIAPSLRLMVLNGEKKGSLHVVTVDGGIIGREGDLQVLIKNPSVSKVHAEITYKSDGPDDHHYYVQDLGSVNGTFVRGQRLSETRKLSDIVEIGHSWEIKVGDVILCCHIHPGLLTCNECEPGLVSCAVDENKTTNGEEPKGKLEKERRRQNKVIRKKFAINYFDPGPALNNSKYRDRAEKRREAVGSDNPYEKTQVASIDTNLTRDNKGFQLMEKMGWSEGQTLGVSDSGLTEPVVPVCQSGRMGFGCHDYPLGVDINLHSSRKIKQRIMKNSKMNDLSTTEPPSQNSEESKGIQPIQFAPSSDNIT